jgi:hypothetical protein
MQPIHTETHGEYTIKIFQDLDAFNPRSEFEQLGTIYHTHQKYDLGEFTDHETIENLASDPDMICLPVYIYEHGNVMLSTGSFSCPWDSGQVGIIAVEKSEILKQWGRKRWSKKLQKLIVKGLEGEVKEFSDYLQGNVYGYEITKANACDSCENADAETIDSCWGFIGDYEYCLNEAKASLPQQKAA